VVQFFSVLLGVLLALLISQWTNHRQQGAKARSALHEQHETGDGAMGAILVELAGNRTNLHDGVVQIYAAVERMNAARGKGKQSPRPCYPREGFGSGQGIFVNLTEAACQSHRHAGHGAHVLPASASRGRNLWRTAGVRHGLKCRPQQDIGRGSEKA
jgi:hypothetical protein